MIITQEKKRKDNNIINKTNFKFKKRARATT